MFAISISQSKSHVCIKVNRYIFIGCSSASFIFVSLDQLLKERICSFWSKFFLLRVDPTLERLCCQVKQTRKSQKLFPIVEMAEKYGGVHIQLKMFFCFFFSKN